MHVRNVKYPKIEVLKFIIEEMIYKVVKLNMHERNVKYPKIRILELITEEMILTLLFN